MMLETKNDEDMELNSVGGILRFLPWGPLLRTVAATNNFLHGCVALHFKDSTEPTSGTSCPTRKRKPSSDGINDAGTRVHKRPRARSSMKPSRRPIELFRKELIHAMKLEDSESPQEEYVFISDAWRQAWDRGVQVPVYPGENQEIEVQVLWPNPSTGDFKLPQKYLHAALDETFQGDIHELTWMQGFSEKVVCYDLDDLDVTWLDHANEEREALGLMPINELTMESIITALEAQCRDKVVRIANSEEGFDGKYGCVSVCKVCSSAACPRNKSKKRKYSKSDSELDSPLKNLPSARIPKKRPSKAHMAKLRAIKLQELQEAVYDAYKVNTRTISTQLHVKREVVELVSVYWRLKVKAR